MVDSSRGVGNSYSTVLSLTLFLSHILHGLPLPIVDGRVLQANSKCNLKLPSTMGFPMSLRPQGWVQLFIFSIQRRSRWQVRTSSRSVLGKIWPEYRSIHATTCWKTLPSALGADTPCASLSTYYISMVLLLIGPLVYMGTKRERERNPYLQLLTS